MELGKNPHFRCPCCLRGKTQPWEHLISVTAAAEAPNSLPSLTYVTPMSSYRVRVWLKTTEHLLLNLCQKRFNGSFAVIPNIFGRAGRTSSRSRLQELLSWSVTDLTKSHFLSYNLEDEESKGNPCNCWLQDPMLLVMIHPLRGLWFVHFKIFFSFIFLCLFTF